MVRSKLGDVLDTLKNYSNFPKYQLPSEFLLSVGSIIERKNLLSIVKTHELLSKNHQIPLNDLKLAFEDTKAIPSIKKLVMPPPPGFQKNWNVYRSRFVEPRRLAAGQKCWVTHRSFIEKTEKETGEEDGRKEGGREGFRGGGG